MRRVMGSSLLIAALALACLGTPADAHHRPTTLQVVGVLNAGSQQQWTSYPLGRLRELRIVGWWNVSGAHVQRLEIRAPDGALYQRLTQPFTAVQSTHATADGLVRGFPVQTVLPVGGTWITEYSLVGTWEIQLYLDNSRTPVASYSLELTP